MKLNRREFVGQAARAAVALGSTGVLSSTSGLTAAEQMDSTSRATLPIIDTHQHLWDLSRFHLPWLKAGEPLNRSFVTKDYLAAVQGLNVVKAVYMEVALEPNEQLAEAKFVTELCRSKTGPTVSGVIAGQLGTPGFAPYIRRFRNSPFIKGVRQILRTPRVKQGLAEERDLVRDLRLLGELGMSFDLCMPANSLSEGIKLVDLCPDTRFVIDHCGNANPRAFGRLATADAQASCDPRQWRRDMVDLAGRKNTVCKISGIVSQVDPKGWSPQDLAPIVNHCLEVFGPDRAMFAGDWPVCTRGATLAQWVTALKEIVADRQEDERRKLFHGNALRFYGLP
jgi:L-fuconolactonase